MSARPIVRVGVLIAVCAAVFLGAGLGAARANAAEYNPNLVISDDSMRAYDSMSAADIQAFLDSKPGPLKSMSFRRHDGGPSASAAVIIYEASQAWKINPRVMLVMLQKEQSLVTRDITTFPLVTGYKSTLDWAIGMGCPDSGVRIEKYRGFGNQLWYGTQRLDSYGEPGKNSVVALWKPGMKYPGGSGRYVYPGNIATYKLYVYNPSIGAVAPYGDLTAQADHLSGNANFWKIYSSWFGDPFADPSIRPVYRFAHKKNGSFLYTSSQAERYRLISRSSGTYKYKGVAFSVNTSDSPDAVPVYAVYDKKKQITMYIASLGTRNRYLRSAKRYSNRGVAFMISPPSDKTVAVYRFQDTKSGGTILVASESEKRAYSKAQYRKRYRYKGIAYYVKR
jgi:hypothetical protein